LHPQAKLLITEAIAEQEEAKQGFATMKDATVDRSAKRHLQRLRLVPLASRSGTAFTSTEGAEWLQKPLF
jgi:hypothetical protein